MINPKQLNNLFSLIFIFTLSSISYSQQMWKLGGNTDAGPPINQGLISTSNYFGATGNSGVRMGTGSLSRIYMSGLFDPNPGFIGIGDDFLTPTFRLHINNGGILSTGNTFGAGTILPNGLTDARMIWYPRKAAFRAGYTNGTEWDDANIGDYSAAFGYNTMASGINSFAFGESTTARQVL